MLLRGSESNVTVIVALNLEREYLFILIFDGSRAYIRTGSTMWLIGHGFSSHGDCIVM